MEENSAGEETMKNERNNIKKTTNKETTMGKNMKDIITHTKDKE